jgi:two-component system KDP operon response regulator KdpE
MTKARRILIIEDDPAITRTLVHTLSGGGYEVRAEGTGKDGLQAAKEFLPGAVLLDLGLPDMSGKQVLNHLREWYTSPILILTALDSDLEKVAALDGGADDYVTKPFSEPVLLARIRVALRHFDKGETEEQIAIGPYEIDISAHLVKVEGKVVKLTATEYDILRVLLRNYGKVVTHRTLLKEVWGPNSVEHHQYVRVYVGQLRKKLRVKPGLPELIQTELGVGYRLQLAE